MSARARLAPWSNLSHDGTVNCHAKKTIVACRQQAACMLLGSCRYKHMSSQGFIIGFSHTRWPDHLCSSQRNMRSAIANPTVIKSYIDEEVKVGRLVLTDTPNTQVHIGSFGIIPKRHQPGKWRLIVDFPLLRAGW